MERILWSSARAEVKAKARKNHLQLIAFDETSAHIDIQIQTIKPAIDDMANISVIEIMADYFNIPKSSLKLTKGKRSCIKWIECTR